MTRIPLLLRAALLAGLVVVLPACGAGAASGGGARASGPITTEEIRASGAADAYQVVQGLRPAWLRRRGETSVAGNHGEAPVGDRPITSRTDPTPLRVYVDGNLVGDGEALRQFPAAEIDRIAFMESGPANVRFGPGHVNGAIVITTRRGN